MKNQFLTFCFLLFTFFLVKNTAAQTFDWAKKMGGTNEESGRSIAVDNLGNVYTTGNFVGTADFDPGPGTFSLTSLSWEIFVNKLDVSGNFVWAKKMDASIQSNGVGQSIAVDDSGNVYITGSFSGTVDFDPGPGTFNLSSKGYSDIFISKLDASGNFIWTKRIGGVNSDNSTSIAVDYLGNVFTTGVFQDTVDFDPGSGTFNLISRSNRNSIFISKLDASGSFLWAKKIGGRVIGQSSGSSIDVDAIGNVYTTGWYTDTAFFDSGTGAINLISSGLEDVFVSKLDTLGNLIWAKSLSGKSRVVSRSIVVDNLNNVYTIGGFRDTVDFNPGSGVHNLISQANNTNDIYVSKLDASGNFVWAKSLRGSASKFGFSIAVDSLQNVYTTGSFYGTVDFDPGPGAFNLTSNLTFGGIDASSDIFVSKLDALGNFVWANKIGGIGEDKGNSIAVDASNNIHTTGFFEETINFNPGQGTNTLISVGDEDIFVSKWSQCNTDTSISINNDTLTADQQGAAYQWLNCNSNFQIINGATNQSFVATMNGSYACEISLNGCTDTTACIPMIVTGIEQNIFSRNYLLYPNPFANQLIIESTNNISSTAIEVLNIKGQLVYESRTNLSGTTVLNTANWVNGIYFIQLTNEEVIARFKLVHH